MTAIHRPVERLVMRFLAFFAAISSFGGALIALSEGDFGSALIMFGGSGAWLTLIFSHNWDS